MFQAEPCQPGKSAFVSEWGSRSQVQLGLLGTGWGVGTGREHLSRSQVQGKDGLDYPVLEGQSSSLGERRSTPAWVSSPPQSSALLASFLFLVYLASPPAPTPALALVSPKPNKLPSSCVCGLPCPQVSHWPTSS